MSNNPGLFIIFLVSFNGVYDLRPGSLYDGGVFHALHELDTNG